MCFAHFILQSGPMVQSASIRVWNIMQREHPTHAIKADTTAQAKPREINAGEN